MPVKAEIRGVEEVSAKMEQVVTDLHGPPFLQGMRDATLIVMRDARIFAPVDTGRLRASIAPEVRTEGKNVLGVVGSNVKYAPYQEKAKRYLQRAFEQNKSKVIKLLERAVTWISNR